MDWKILFMTFGTIFLAELGDKTQLATLTFSTEAKGALGMWTVFAGAALALTLSSLIAVFVGQVLEKYVPAGYLKTCAAVSFIVIGAWMLIGILRGKGA
jgi:Ca2+/H+ antiporter, TMEM165/GDT1 family